MKGIAFIVLLIAAMFFMSSHTTAATDECTTADAVFAIAGTENVSYNVTTFTVTVGSCLEIRLEDQATISHSFVLERANGTQWTRLAVDTQGQVDSVKLQMPDTPNDFIFYCDQPGHRANGMEGRIHVVLNTITSDCTIYDAQFNLAIDSTGFNTTEFHVTEGFCLQINYINLDSVSHNLLILNSTQGIAGYISELGPNDQAFTILYMPPAGITYTFISGPPAHAQAGNAGKIITDARIAVEECPTADAYLRLESHLNGDLKFNVTSITVAQGSCLQVSVINKGDIQLDFTVDMPNGVVDSKLDQNQMVVYRLQMPNQDITIDFYDSTVGHRDAGEQGTIIVGQGNPSTSVNTLNNSSKPGIVLPAFEWFMVIPTLMLLPLIKSKYHS